MFDLPSQPVIDKNALVGGCVRLGLQADPDRLRTEVAAIPASDWGATAGRIGHQSAAQAIFLRGYAPAEGQKPIEDRPILQQLPYVRSIVEELIPASPMRALLARLPAGAAIPPHYDRLPYFSKTLRVHIPIETNDQVWMICAGRAYQMRPGEVWVLNNSTQHAVRNDHPSSSRTHLICDFLPRPALIELVQAGDRNLGKTSAELDSATQ